MVWQFVKTTFLAGVPFGLFFGVVYLAISQSFAFALVVGATVGLAFGLALAAFTGYQSWRFKTQRPPFGEERLLREGGSNRWLHGESVGGWIYLTDARMLFVSHKANVQRHKLSIPLREISDVLPARNFGIIPNGLLVRTASGETVKFVVWDRKGWVREIQHAKEQAP